MTESEGISSVAPIFTFEKPPWKFASLGIRRESKAWLKLLQVFDNFERGFVSVSRLRRHLFCTTKTAYLWRLKMKSCLSFLFGVLFLLACSHEMPVEKNGESQLPQWPMFGKNLRHTSNAANPVEYYPGPKQGQIIWTVDFGFFEDSYTSPSIGPDGTIYLATTPPSITADSGFVYAINPNGTIKWRFRTPKGNARTGAVGSDGSYYVASNDKNLYAIGSDGKLKWKQNLQSYFRESFYTDRPTITRQGEIVLPVSSGIIALNTETGEISWFYETTAISSSAISVDRNGNIYASTLEELLALSSEGNKKWGFSVPSPGPHEVTIAGDGTLLFTIPGDSLLYALSQKGEVKWTFNLAGHSRDNVVGIASDGTIVTMNAGKIPQKIYKVSLTGQLLWEIEISQLIGKNAVSLNNTTPIIDQSGTMYIVMGLTGGDNLYALNQNGVAKWSVTIEDPFVSISTVPAIAPDGTMYVVGDHSVSAVR